MCNNLIKVKLGAYIPASRKNIHRLHIYINAFVFAEVKSVDTNILSERLSHFHIAVRPKYTAENNSKKQFYHKSFLLNISCVINRFLKDNKREIDVHVIGDKRIQNRVRSCWLFRWLLT